MFSSQPEKSLAQGKRPVGRLLPRAWTMGTSLLLAFLLSAGLFGLHPVTASAATLSAHQAVFTHQAQQDSIAIQEKVTNLLKTRPGSKQTAWNTVTFDGGLTVRYLPHANLAATAYYGCPNQWWCVFSLTYFGGIEIADVEYDDCREYDTSYVGGFVGIKSYSNYTYARIDVKNSTDSYFIFSIFPGHSSNSTWANQEAWSNSEFIYVNCY